MYKTLHTVAGLLLLAGPAVAAGKSGYSPANPTPRTLLRELSTDRPDQTESPYTVDAGHFQIEMDFVHHGSRHDTSGGAGIRTKIRSIAPLNQKTGLTIRVDLQLILDSHLGFRVKNRGAGTVLASAQVKFCETIFPCQISHTHHS